MAETPKNKNKVEAQAQQSEAAKAKDSIESTMRRHNLRAFDIQVAIAKKKFGYDPTQSDIVHIPTRLKKALENKEPPVGAPMNYYHTMDPNNQNRFMDDFVTKVKENEDADPANKENFEKAKTNARKVLDKYRLSNIPAQVSGAESLGIDDDQIKKIGARERELQIVLRDSRGTYTTELEAMTFELSVGMSSLAQMLILEEKEVEKKNPKAKENREVVRKEFEKVDGQISDIVERAKYGKLFITKGQELENIIALDPVFEKRRLNDSNNLYVETSAIEMRAMIDGAIPYIEKFWEAEKKARSEANDRSAVDEMGKTFL